MLKKMLHLFCANYLAKLIELMVVVYLKRYSMQVDSYIYNVKKLVKGAILLNPSSLFTVTKPEVVFSSKESIIKAAILQALETVGSNFSFASANGNGKLLRKIVPGSDIAKGYKQSETKIKYSFQFGLAPYFMQCIQDDFLGRAFSFKFDETTSSQVKKQCGGSIQYWSNSMRCIVVSYCRSLFVGHCPSGILVEHFFLSLIKKPIWI